MIDGQKLGDIMLTCEDTEQLREQISGLSFDEKSQLMEKLKIENAIDVSDEDGQ